jgi:hypothetical protein
VRGGILSKGFVIRAEGVGGGKDREAKKVTPEDGELLSYGIGDGKRVVRTVQP